MIVFLLKSVLILAVLFTLYKVLLEREKMHRFNRFYLLGALVVSFALPVITIPVYIETEALAPKPVPVALETTQTVQSYSVQPQLQQTIEPQTHKPPVKHIARQTNYLPYVLWGVYGIITLLLVVRFVLNISRFYDRARRNKQEMLNGATLVLLPDCPLPYTFMNFIFVNQSQYEGQTIEAELFTHELAHVQQKHTLDVLFIEALKTVFWFNPLLYMYKKAIQTNHEFLADEAVIHKHLNIPTYQLLLLDKATPPLAFALASSINFSTTKKRFAMMTKTTSKTKALLLRAAVAPVATGLVYLFSIQTVAYSKAPNGTFNPVITHEPKAEKLLPEVVAVAEKADSVIAEATTLQPADTVAGDARRNEYFKGVRIVIDDKPRGVSINAPYEKVSEEHKRYYLNNVPKKFDSDPISQKDYDFYFNREECIFYLNEQKVTREEMLKYKREDFVYSAYKMYGTHTPGEKEMQNFYVFLFTRPYFEKKMKHLNDHYPNKQYTIVVTAKPGSKQAEIDEDNKKDASGKRAYERDADAQQAKFVGPTYDFIKEKVESAKVVELQFPGGKEAFEKYIYDNLKLSEEIKSKEIWVFYSVNTDGSLTDVEARGTDKETAEEILRVFTASPRWIPQQKDGKPRIYSTSITLFRQKK
ncbi:M56 family metallopeptidase [Flavobacterium sp. RHBU_3]|uniref:M56 family metallopeptidase n=1 Tax=Flavobacterium sp. RHBU_3 TaxID=3391184 RepID=UPI003984EDD4